MVLFGPLADVARQLLVSNFPLRFGTIDSDQVVKMAMIDTIMAANKHCRALLKDFTANCPLFPWLKTHVLGVLIISPGSVEPLQLSQYAPIVVLIDIDSRNRIRELRSKAGATTLSARKLMEQSSKVKKHHSHLLTGE